MKVWRLCRAGHTRFDGEGARIAGGRWNLRGTRVVYASATLSLAAAEMFVHLASRDQPPDLVSIPAEIPEDLAIERVGPSDLPKGWSRYPAPEALAAIGTAWAQSRRTAVLAVPSAVIAMELNYLLNPEHPAFRRIKVGPSRLFSFDQRIWRHPPG